MDVDSDYNPMRDFFERLGHKIITTQNGCWYEVQPRVLLSIPYYKQIEPTEQELADLVKEHNLRAIRFPTTLDSYGFFSNITINTNNEYDFTDLHQKARNQTRRGLENCKVEQLEFDWLIENAMPLNQDTAQRQGRECHFTDTDYWGKYCRAAAQTEGITAWGAFFQGRLASFLISATAENNWQEWVVNHSATDIRNKYSNNALSFTVAKHFLCDQKCNGVCYGLGSLEETGQLDHFKSRMGWVVKPIKQRLVFSSKLALASKLAKEPLLAILNKLFPLNYTVRKASAMFRLYNKQTTDPTEQDSV